MIRWYPGKFVRELGYRAQAVKTIEDVREIELDTLTGEVVIRKDRWTTRVRPRYVEIHPLIDDPVKVEAGGSGKAIIRPIFEDYVMEVEIDEEANVVRVMATYGME